MTDMKLKDMAGMLYMRQDRDDRRNREEKLLENALIHSFPLLPLKDISATWERKKSKQERKKTKAGKEERKKERKRERKKERKKVRKKLRKKERKKERKKGRKKEKK